MNLVDRFAVHSTAYPNRPILGGVIHDTESHGDITTEQSLGGWHYTVQRDGTINSDVSEENAAWGVRACDRWRPAWVVNAPDNGVSPVNYCSLNIEIISDQGWRDSGEPYTEPQYDALIELLADIEQRRGRLWWVGHGELQLDRTDPVSFDWARAGLSENDGVNGRTFTARQQTDEEVEQMNRLSECQDALSELERDRDWGNRVKREFETLLRNGGLYRKVQVGKTQRGTVRYVPVGEADIQAAVSRANAV